MLVLWSNSTCCGRPRKCPCVCAQRDGDGVYLGSASLGDLADQSLLHGFPLSPWITLPLVNVLFIPCSVSENIPLLCARTHLDNWPFPRVIVICGEDRNSEIYRLKDFWAIWSLRFSLIFLCWLDCYSFGKSGHISYLTYCGLLWKEFGHLQVEVPNGNWFFELKLRQQYMVYSLYTD